MGRIGWEWQGRLETPGALTVATLADASQEVGLAALDDSVRPRQEWWAAARREPSGRRRQAGRRRSAGAQEDRPSALPVLP